jgi:hypothetical protein
MPLDDNKSGRIWVFFYGLFMDPDMPRRFVILGAG